MPDYPPGYDPIQADYNSGSYISPGDQAIGGLIGLSAFALIGIAAFFTYGAAIAAPLTLYTVTYTIQLPGTQTFVNRAMTFCTNGTALTQGQAQIVAAVSSQGVGGIAPTTIAELLKGFGMTMLTADSLLALAAYDVNTATNPFHFGNFGNYLGGNIGGSRFPGPGGFSEPPGFPGFPGTGGPQTGPWGGGHRTAVCYRWIDDSIVCFFQD